MSTILDADSYIPVNGTGENLETAKFQNDDGETVHREAVYIGSPTTYGAKVEVDAVTGALVVMDSEHYRIHQGDGYHISHVFGGVASLATADVLIVVPAGVYPHVRMLTATSDTGPLHTDLYEGTTVSANGTGITPFNMNRNSANAAGTAVYHSPTVTDLGTRLFEYHAPNAGNKAGAETDGLPVEWMLKAGETYLFRITNEDNSAADLSAYSFFYEA